MLCFSPWVLDSHMEKYASIFLGIFCIIYGSAFCLNFLEGNTYILFKLLIHKEKNNEIENV